MTERDQQRIAELVGDAFAILCVRICGISAAEKNLRLGMEATLRQLGTSPLREITRTLRPIYSQVTASSGDLRNIIRALDACLAVLQRYDTVLTATERRVQSLVRASRGYADEELAARRNRVPMEETADVL
ncbi:MAG TPA: hypothetical protein VM029_18765 [Opitutaceae bacterium]|nr:hypothetical protein [Opitutaceae bacterium]